MRPRVFPAEDLLSLLTRRLSPPSFNEAAGIPRGRRARVEKVVLSESCFNEAAGIPRGRHRARGAIRGQRHRFNEAAGIPRGRLSSHAHGAIADMVASMRPRVFPAEDLMVPRRRSELMRLQ